MSSFDLPVTTPALPHAPETSPQPLEEQELLRAISKRPHDISATKKKPTLRRPVLMLDLEP